MTLRLFISHSSHTDKARKLRDVVAKHLDAKPGIEVLWDQDIKPGQRWRTKLDEWLAECTGGVVLFSKDAIDSSWVLKEAQILTWRKALVERFLLIPVLLEPVKAKQTGLEDWQPVRINEIQFLKGADPEMMNDQAREQLAKEIADAIAAEADDTDFEELDDPLREWLDNLADDLTEAGATRLKTAALALGIGAADGPPDEDPHAWARLVARRLLHFGCEPTVAGVAKESFDAAAKVLKKAVRTFPEEARERIASQFFPVWVHPDAARNICPSVHTGLPVGINGSYWETGQHYADRATCGQASEHKCVIALPDIHDGNPEVIWQRYDTELKTRLRLLDVEPTNWKSEEQVKKWKQELRNVVKQKGPIFVVLFGDACKPIILEKLQKRYSPFVIMLMLGESIRDLAQQGFGEIALLDPPLPTRRERQVLRLYDELV